MSQSQPEVTVYSTPTCPFCTMVKMYLAEKNIVYKDVDVSRNQEEAIKMVERSGQRGVPQLLIGKEVVIGYDTNRINLLLHL